MSSSSSTWSGFSPSLLLPHPNPHRFTKKPLSRAPSTSSTASSIASSLSSLSIMSSGMSMMSGAGKSRARKLKKSNIPNSPPKLQPLSFTAEPIFDPTAFHASASPPASPPSSPNHRPNRLRKGRSSSARRHSHILVNKNDVPFPSDPSTSRWQHNEQPGADNITYANTHRDHHIATTHAASADDDDNDTDNYLVSSFRQQSPFSSASASSHQPASAPASVNTKSKSNTPAYTPSHTHTDSVDTITPSTYSLPRTKLTKKRPPLSPIRTTNGPGPSSEPSRSQQHPGAHLTSRSQPSLATSSPHSGSTFVIVTPRPTDSGSSVATRMPNTPTTAKTKTTSAEMEDNETPPTPPPKRPSLLSRTFSLKSSSSISKKQRASASVHPLPPLPSPSHQTAPAPAPSSTHDHSQTHEAGPLTVTASTEQPVPVPHASGPSGSPADGHAISSTGAEISAGIDADNQHTNHVTPALPLPLTSETAANATLTPGASSDSSSLPHPRPHPGSAYPATAPSSPASFFGGATVSSSPAGSPIASGSGSGSGSNLNLNANSASTSTSTSTSSFARWRKWTAGLGAGGSGSGGGRAKVAGTSSALSSRTSLRTSLESGDGVGSRVGETQKGKQKEREADDAHEGLEKPLGVMRSQMEDPEGQQEQVKRRRKASLIKKRPAHNGHARSTSELERVKDVDEDEQVQVQPSEISQQIGGRKKSKFTLGSESDIDLPSSSSSKSKEKEKAKVDKAVQGKLKKKKDAKTGFGLVPPVPSIPPYISLNTGNTDASTPTQSPKTSVERPPLLRRHAVINGEHQVGRRRWTLASAMTDEGISDERLVKELERMRELGAWTRRRERVRTASVSGGAGGDGDGEIVEESRVFETMEEEEEDAELEAVNGVLRDMGREIWEGSGPGSASTSSLNSNPSPTAATSTSTSTSTPTKPPSSPSWLAAQRALLTCRELILTERHYLAHLHTLLAQDTQGTPPPLMLRYAEELARVSAAVLRDMEHAPSVGGVARAFVEREEEVGAAYVGWCGVVGAWFVDAAGGGGGGGGEYAGTGTGYVKRKRSRPGVAGSEYHGSGGGDADTDDGHYSSSHGHSSQGGFGSTGALVMTSITGAGAGTMGAQQQQTQTQPSYPPVSPLKRTVSTWRRSMPSIASLGLDGGVMSIYGNGKREKVLEREAMGVLVPGHGSQAGGGGAISDVMGGGGGGESSPSKITPRKPKPPAVRELAILPTQRVMRYVLLYRDLLAHTPHTSASRVLVERAVEAACRIAEKCDRAQENAAFIGLAPNASNANGKASGGNGGRNNSRRQAKEQAKEAAAAAAASLAAVTSRASSKTVSSESASTTSESTNSSSSTSAISNATSLTSVGSGSFEGEGKGKAMVFPSKPTSTSTSFLSPLDAVTRSSTNTKTKATPRPKRPSTADAGRRRSSFVVGLGGMGISWGRMGEIQVESGGGARQHN